MDNKKFIIADANTAASRVAYKLTDCSVVYPITPSTPMAESYEALNIKNEKNIFGDLPTITEMQSEAGAIAAIHGLALNGRIATTFTASQGLLLMLPDLFKMVGERLPGVLHVTSRAIAAHALNIFGDHSDVYAMRTAGAIMLASGSPLEAQDFAAISHLLSVKASLPVIHFFDGFRTSHEVNKMPLLTDAELQNMINLEEIKAFRETNISSNKPFFTGSNENEDIFFQHRIAGEFARKDTFKQFEEVLATFGNTTGRNYKPYTYYGDPDAENVIVTMGSSSKTFKTLYDILKIQGAKPNFGVLEVHLFRPFISHSFVSSLPASAKNICILDRAIESGSVNGALATDCISALLAEKRQMKKIISGAYGLGGKDFSLDDSKAVLDNLISLKFKNHFNASITDDLMNSGLAKVKLKDSHNKNNWSAKFFGIGSDGMVSASKNVLKIIGESTGNYVQGYAEYDSKKSGGITISHIRISPSEINKPYLVRNADLVSFNSEDLLDKLGDDEFAHNGTCIINLNDANKLLDHPYFMYEFAKNHLNVFILDANSIAQEVGLNRHINLVMQAAIFAKTQFLPLEEAKAHTKRVAKQYNLKEDFDFDVMFKRVIESLKQVNLSQFNISSIKVDEMRNLTQSLIDRQGNNLPVSAFTNNGRFETNTSKLNKNSQKAFLPKFIPENCINCGRCSFYCPHAVIRPAKVNGKYRQQICPSQCTGCAVCVEVCPTKALIMAPFDEIFKQEDENYKIAKPVIKSIAPSAVSVNTLQFLKPYFEFAGACSGCGETPYIKILSQLYGNHLVIANATGCTSIYGGAPAGCPYVKDENGRGTAWANSLFEDNAEFGLGLYLAYKQKRDIIKSALSSFLETNASNTDSKIIKTYLSSLNSYEKTTKLSAEILEIAKRHNLLKVIENADAIVKQTFWIIGGDGWAFDIGFGGLDHVISQGEDLNILVLNTGTYSNTGGQTSKATPKGAIATFSKTGKKTNTKNLAEYVIDMYPDTFVSSVSIGANPYHTLESFVEAEKHQGTSIIVAYSSCISHKSNLTVGNAHQELGNEAGFISLFTHNPNKKKKFELVSEKPNVKLLTKFFSEEGRFKAAINIKEQEKYYTEHWNKLNKRNQE